jgi:SAM-dependent methyltransferase
LRTCWICQSNESEPFLTGDLRAATSEDLRITDHRYGQTAPLFRCSRCGFVFAHPVPSEDLVRLYSELEDPEYVSGAPYRVQQMASLLDRVLAQAPKARTLLDVGAGNGQLVHAAAARGLHAVGVEPSRALSEDARHRGLDVRCGVLSEAGLDGQVFDLVTCIDVIEHVADPIALLRAMAAYVAPDGVLVVSTPQVDSVARRLLGRRWWHFRMAHVCFFSDEAMQRALAAVGFRVSSRHRQVWWFSASYLVERLGSFGPGRRSADALRRLSRLPVLGAFHVPLDLRDSWVYLCQRDSRP